MTFSQVSTQKEKTASNFVTNSKGMRIKKYEYRKYTLSLIAF